MMKTTSSINIIIPALTRPTPTYYELHLLHMAYKYPYNRQSSCMSFTATATSYIQVTQILKLCMETTFSQLLDPTSGLPSNTSGLPKILHWLHLSLLTTLGLWGAPYE